jgi:hypothetical protein
LYYDPAHPEEDPQLILYLFEIILLLIDSTSQDGYLVPSDFDIGLV